MYCDIWFYNALLLSAGQLILTCGFDRNGKWSGFCKSCNVVTWGCDIMSYSLNDVMTSYGDRCLHYSVNNRLILWFTLCVYFQTSRYGSSRYSDPTGGGLYDRTSYSTSRTDRPGSTSSSYSRTSYGGSTGSLDKDGAVDYKKVRNALVWFSWMVISKPYWRENHLHHILKANPTNLALCHPHQIEPLFSRCSKNVACFIGKATSV